MLNAQQACYNITMEFAELSESEVRKLDFSCNNFLQSWEMYRRYHEIGREAYLVGVRDFNGKVLAAGLMSARSWRFGKKIFRVPGGWLMNYDSKKYPEILKFITEKAKRFCRSKGGMLLEIAPNLITQPRDAHNHVLEGENHLGVKTELERLGYKYLGEFEQVKWTFTLPLTGKTADGIFSAFRTDHRQRIHRAEREGVRVRELSIDELDILKQIAAEAGERHGFKDPDLDYYRSMKRAFGDKVKFVVAELPAEKLGGAEDTFVPLAAAMFVLDKNEIVYLYSGSVRSLQKYGGAHLIQWQMIQEALQKECKKYNFYGVRPVEGDGVYNFKLGFRGQVDELLGTFVLPLDLMGKFYASRLHAQEYGDVH